MTHLIQFLVDLPLIPTLLFKITVLLSAGWLLHFVLIRHNPRLRVLLWRGVMVGVVVLPAIEILMPKFQVPVSELSGFVPGSTVGSHNFEKDQGRVDTHTLLFSIASGDQPKNSFKLISWVKNNRLVIIVFGWAIISLILGLRSIHAAVRIHRTISASDTAPERIWQLAKTVASQLQCRSRFDILTNPDIASPFLSGVLKSTIILPESITKENDGKVLHSIFAHELQHLKSHDIFWIKASKWLSILLWFHPLMWKLRSVHATACEEVCDSVASDYVGSRSQYSQTLAQLALQVTTSLPQTVEVPMIRSSEISKRLQRLKRNISAGRLKRRLIVPFVLVGGISLIGIGGFKLGYATDLESDTEKPKGLDSQKESEHLKTNTNAHRLKAEAEADAARQAEIDEMLNLNLPALELEDQDIDSVLTLIGTISGFKIIATEGIEGLMTVNIRDTTVKEALDRILHPNGFRYEVNGKTITVLTSFETKIFPLSDIEYKKLEKFFEDPTTLQNPEENLRRLIYGKRGISTIPGKQLRLHPRTRSLVATDTKSNIGIVDNFLKEGIPEFVKAEEPLEYGTYILEPTSAERLYQLIEYTLYGELGVRDLSQDDPRLLVLDKERSILIVRDTLERLKEVEAILNNQASNSQIVQPIGQAQQALKPD